MELRVINKADEKFRVEIGGEDHTFMNVLKDEPLQTDIVMATTYDVNPEQSGRRTGPILSVETESSVDPLDAPVEAARGVQRTADDFIDAYHAGIDA